MGKLALGLIVGSNRTGSINMALARALAALCRDRADTTFIEIAALPMYNGDLEEDRPHSVNAFTAAVRDCEAILIVTPEYNRSVPPVLKNAIDWGSKPLPKNVWRNKVFAISGTSPSSIGTAVGQQHLRQILAILGGLVMGGEAYISYTPNLFSEDDGISNESTRLFLSAYLDRFIELAIKLR